jgi:hypothetical protein
VIAGPDFMIVGAMKCATSSLHEQLAAMPGIFMSRPKEPNFFSDDAVWARGIGWYEGLFAAAPPGALKGESSTHYTKLPTHPHTLERLAASVATRRFVYVMRDPIDRLVSHYIHEWTQRQYDEPIDEAALRRPELVAYSSYAMQLRPWLERFGPEAVLPVFFERLTAAPDAELARIARFLGHAGEARWRDDLGAQNVSRERLRTSALRDAVVASPALTFLRRALVPKRVRDLVKRAWQMRERPELSARRRAELARTFDADLAKLGRWLGVALDSANFAEVARATAATWSDQAPRRAT